MTPDTKLVLGDFTFAGFEIPASLEGGGKQRLVVHELVGGTRIVDAMGRSEAPLAWSGYMRGAGAIRRAQYLDYLRAKGAQLTLTWSQYRYQVVIESFTWNYSKFYELTYQISCTVVADQTTTPTSVPATPIDIAMSSDNLVANTLVATVGDSQLTQLMGTLNTAIGNVLTFVNLTQSAIALIKQPMQSVQARVAALLGLADASISQVPGFAGVSAGLQAAVLATSLAGILSSTNTESSLLGLGSVLGRMSANLSVANSSQTVPFAGGNLYSISDAHYGDASAWTGIAKANGLTDPNLRGTGTLVIPASPDNAGGVLAA